MDQFRAILRNIQKHLGGMSASQKLLLGSLAVIMLMTLFLVSQYAGGRTLSPLMPGASAEDQRKALAVLRPAGFNLQEGVEGLMVPPDQRERAIAMLAESGNQPANTAVVFENILKTQNWMNSREQNRQIFKVMLDNWLSGVLSNFSGIRQAKVFVDAPEPAGIGHTARRPKASITLFSSTGRAVPQETVDAAARLVAGSVSGLDVESVVVNDATAGKSRKVTSDSDLTPASYLEYAGSVEKQFKAKIENLLRYMDPPAVVEVTATVDVTRVKSEVSTNLPLGGGSISVPESETSSSTTSTEPSTGAEAGPRSNVMADINAGLKGVGKSETKQDETKFHNAIGTRRESIDDPRGHPTRLVATIAVPRAYVEQLIQRENPVKEGEQPKAPTAAEVQTRFDDANKGLRADIERSLKPHVSTRTREGQEVPGEVVVTLVSGELYASNGLGGGAPNPGGGGGGNSPGGGFGGSIGNMIASGGSALWDRLLLGGLSLFAVGMMFLLVRKSGRRGEVPSAQELVGRPPTLEAKSDLVGEADETETAMAGIIVGEDQIKAEKMREQVSEMVRQNPEGASKLLNRWISVEE